MANDLEQLVARVFVTRNSAHLAHWRATGTGSFAKHMALGDFYDAIIGKIDEIVEVHQGAFGKIGKLPLVATPSEDGLQDHIAKEAMWINDNREKIAQKVGALENLLDDLAGIYLRTHYKLEFLK